MILQGSVYSKNRKNLKKMPNEHEKRSTAESGLQEKNSVYDFLYQDVHRIGSFLSQFDPNGHLQSSTRSNSLSQNRSASEDKSLTGKLPIVAEGKVANSHSNSEFNKNDSSKTYDPLWQNSLALLDYLEQRNLINKNILNSHIGQFVLVTGKLVILDIGFIQRILKDTSLKKTVVQNAAGGKNNKSSMNLGIEIFGSIPAAIQAHLHSPDISAWSTLKSEGLSLSTDDLHLKHGPSIAGEWNILGIIDALPMNDEPDISRYPLFLRNFNEFFGEIKKLCGRPSNYFGITPLLVFRKVTGN